MCQLTAVNYTTISKGSEVSIENTGSAFASVDTIVITNEKCQSIRLQVNPNRKQLFKINVNNHTITYESSEGQASEEISIQLTNRLNEADINVKAKLVDEDILITSKEVAESFICFVSEGITIISCTNNALFKAKNKGSVIAPSHAVNTIRTPISGWISVSNINAAITGKNLESDSRLKARRKLSLKMSGSGTVEAIRARLLSLKGVTKAVVTQNDTDKEDSEGRPPSSFEALVVGAEDSDIAKVIWLAKPGGIQPWGNRTLIVQDSNGDKQVVKFSRPIKKYVYARIELKTADRFTRDSADLIKQAVVNQINSKDINEGLIYQSLFASVYSTTAKIMNADIKIGVTTLEDQVPELKTADIEVKIAEILTTDSSKIIVEAV